MFTLPTFNLVCNVWSNHNTGVARRAQFTCNLAWGRRVNMPTTGGTGLRGVAFLDMQLLLPKLTDIRGPLSSTSYDAVEVPSGSGRFYSVEVVDDIGKGFSNEHRCALLRQETQPTPLT